MTLSRRLAYIEQLLAYAENAAVIDDASVATDSAWSGFKVNSVLAGYAAIDTTVSFSGLTVGGRDILGEIDALASAVSSHTHSIGDVTGLQGALDAKVSSALLGVANGIATLDGGGKIPAAQLPAYVDDVLEFANLAAFPASGSTGVIYVAIDTNRVYRWSGSAYFEISAAPSSTDAITEGGTNLYYTDARVRAAVLTGLVGTAGTIGATDSVLVALGKAKQGLADVNTALGTKASSSLIGAANGIASLGADGKVPASQLPAAGGGGDAMLAGDNTFTGVNTFTARMVFSAAALPSNLTVDGSGTVSANSSLGLVLKGRGSATDFALLNRNGATVFSVGPGTQNVGFDGSVTVSGTLSAGGSAVLTEAKRNVANGFAGLDSSGLIPSTILPSYVDDVLEYANLAAFPATGESGKLYVAADTSYSYRWTGSTYAQIVASPGTIPWGNLTGTLANQTDLQSALNGKEPTLAAGTSAQYYRGDKTWQTLNKSAVGLGNVDNTSDAAKPVSTAQQAAIDAVKKGTVVQASVAGKTLALTDAGETIVTTGTVSIPDNATVAFPIGTTIEVYNDSGANISITIGGTDVLRLVGTATTGTRTLAQRGLAVLKKVKATEWVAGGVS